MCRVRQPLAYAGAVDSGTRKRLASLTLALVLVTPLSVVAARWQWSRHLERDALNAAVLAAQQTAPVPVNAIGEGPGFGPAVQWRRVTAAGTWDASRQLLVRKQVVDGEVGFTVMTPFVADDGKWLFVLRGWVPSADTAIPAPPSGLQQVLLRIRSPHGDEPIRPSDLPPGQINRVDPMQLSELYQDDQTSVIVKDSWNAVFELIDPVPAGLTPIPWPTLTEGPHVSYTIQWILIGLTGIIVYVRVFRSEWRISHESDAKPADDPTV